MQLERKSSLKMVSCPHCQARVFIPGDLAPRSFTACPKCEGRVMMPMMLRQYELRDEIASGGMGTVYRAFDTTLGREVAVKLMKSELTQDTAAVESFAREARSCAAFNHTNLITTHTFDEYDGFKYLVMELADQGSLDSRIERQQRVPELDVLDVGVKVAGALNAAYKHGLLHLDIKPGNILFNFDGEPKLVDFGLAKKADAEKEYNAPIFGTPYYIAPERVSQQGESFLSDMYSLAGTLYHALVGHVPFEAPTVEEVVVAQINTALTPPNHVLPEISGPTSDAIVRAMSKNPADRFGSYDEFIMALTAARSQLLVRQFAPQTSAQPSGTGGSRWWRR